MLRQDPAGAADKANILLHGIGVGAQRAGVAAAEALGAFERWVGEAPLVAFHAAFDEAMIERCDAGGPRPRRCAGPGSTSSRWPERCIPRCAAAALDDWLAHFGIECAVRHQAAADTLATAELLLRLWPAARAQRCTSFSGLGRLADARRWLGPG